MAWQSPAMSGLGGIPGSMGDSSNGGHPQGTEYTLQGESFLPAIVLYDNHLKLLTES